MIRAFKNLRIKWLNSGKLAKYLTYALGEILLVVIGILIALQINTSNERIKREQAFDFNIKQLHQQFTLEKLMNSSIAETYIFQIHLIDSILNFPNEFKEPYLPEILQFLEVEMIKERNRQVNREFTKTFLSFDKDNEFVNNLSTLLYKHLNDEQFLLESDNYFQPPIDINLGDYLSAFNIPRTTYPGGMNFDDFIKDSYTRQKNIIKDIYGVETSVIKMDTPEQMLDILENDKFRTSLLNLKQHKIRLISGLYVLTLSCDRILNIMQKEYPTLKILFENISIIGSATPSSDWNTDYPMAMIDKNGMQWETEIQLHEGQIKFRNDPFWIFNWGRSNNDRNKIKFNGNNISVDSGYYKVILDLDKGSIKMELIEN